MKTADLLLSHLRTLDTLTADLLAYANKSGPDGWDKEELEAADTMLNGILRQVQCSLGIIGEPLKEIRNAE